MSKIKNKELIVDAKPIFVDPYGRAPKRFKLKRTKIVDMDEALKIRYRIEN